MGSGVRRMIKAFGNMILCRRYGREVVGVFDDCSDPAQPGIVL